MKAGFRKPSVKKSLKARTTGKVKRSIKKSVNPLYGKKGMGYINDPKKAVYNKVYNKTTVGVSDFTSDSNTSGSRMVDGLIEFCENNENVQKLASPKVLKVLGFIFKVLSIVYALLFILFLFADITSWAIFLLIFAVIFWIVGANYSKKAKKLVSQQDELKLDL